MWSSATSDKANASRREIPSAGARRLNSADAADNMA